MFWKFLLHCASTLKKPTRSSTTRTRDTPVGGGREAAARSLRSCGFKRPPQLLSIHEALKQWKGFKSHVVAAEHETNKPFNTCSLNLSVWPSVWMCRVWSSRDNDELWFPWIPCLCQSTGRQQLSSFLLFFSGLHPLRVKGKTDRLRELVANIFRKILSPIASPNSKIGGYALDVSLWQVSNTQYHGYFNPFRTFAAGNGVGCWLPKLVAWRKP